MAAGDQVLALGDVPIVQDVRQQHRIGPGRERIAEHVPLAEFEPVGHVVALSELIRDSQHLGTVDDDRAQQGVALEQSDAVDPRAAADIDEQLRIAEVDLCRESGGDVLGPSGEGEGEVPGEVGLLHR